MWSFNNINIFVYLCCIAFVEAEDICGQPYKLPNWESNMSERSADLRLGKPSDISGGLEAQVENVRENFSLTLLANPFINEESKCPPANSSYLDLRKFNKNYNIIKGVNEQDLKLFSKIFTGCYYGEITNTEGRKWLWDPIFVNTSYHYYDTMLNCTNFRVKPRDYEQSRQLRYDIEVPLTCLQVRCQLYEYNKETNYTKHNSYVGNTSATQDCLITNIDNGTAPVWKCMKTDTRLKLYASITFAKNEGWKTSITWDNLKQEGAYYVALFQRYNHTCHMNYADLMTWEPVVQFGALKIHSFNNDSNTVSSSEHPDFFQSAIFRSILQILLGITVIVILVYWTSKYARILLKRKQIAHNILPKSQEIFPLHDQREPNHILLIYARDSTPFMTIMNNFRDRLQETSHLPVHDIYSINECDIILKLGAIGWVEELLRNGCKIVWVDTPQFRSVLKNNKLDNYAPKQHIAHDFRDEAIPYVVTLATNLFQNTTTQYRCHFVVRLEGFQVEDEVYDPLLMVSPHARYRIPEHFSVLCEHLTR